jgi:hypothetical protein
MATKLQNSPEMARAEPEVHSQDNNNNNNNNNNISTN